MEACGSVAGASGESVRDEVSASGEVLADQVELKALRRGLDMVGHGFQMLPDVSRCFQMLQIRFWNISEPLQQSTSRPIGA